SARGSSRRRPRGWARRWPMTRCPRARGRDCRSRSRTGSGLDGGKGARKAVTPSPPDAWLSGHRLHIAGELFDLFAGARLHAGGGDGVAGGEIVEIGGAHIAGGFAEILESLGFAALPASGRAERALEAEG